jgi:transcriptional regulator with XRE-family HTH domain
MSPTPDAAALGRAVRLIRDERGISQVQLAEATGFMQSWISHVERGARNPSWNNVARLAEGLGVSPAELVKRAEACADSPT